METNIYNNYRIIITIGNMASAIDSLQSTSLKIRNTRKGLGISQKELADRLGLSQSTIARLESDIEDLNPSYKNVYAVVSALEATAARNSNSRILEKTAADIMHRKIVYVTPDDTIGRAVKIIKDYDFPQIPVLNRKLEEVGTVRQKRLLSIATDYPEKISTTKIRDIIEPSLPQVSKYTEVSKIKLMLDNFDAVLVMDKGKVVGIITIYDILKMV